MTERNSISIAKKVFALAGLLAVIGFGSFAVLTVASYGFPVAMRGINAAAVYLSSVFVPKERLEIKLADEVFSGYPFTLSFEHVGKSTDGSYTLYFPCVDGLSLVATSASGAAETVYCNVPFHFVNSDNALSITAVSAKNRYVDLSLSINFTPNGMSAVSLSGQRTAILTNTKIALSSNYLSANVPAPTTTPVSNTGSTGTSGTPKPLTPGTKTEQSQTTGPFYGSGTPTTTVSNPSGKPDLVAKLIAIGVITGTANDFTATTTVRRSDKIAVKFSVENLGNKNSGEWRFNGILPTYPAYTLNSDAQTSLAPGDKIEFTMAFDRALDGAREVKIVLDPATLVIESDENNNTLTVPMTIL